MAIVDAVGRNHAAMGRIAFGLLREDDVIRKIRYLLLLPVALMSLAVPVLSGETRLTPAQMRKDLAFLKDEWAPLDKSFNDQEQRAFRKLVEDTTSASEKLTSEAFAMAVAQAAAIAHNGHTNANVWPFLGKDLPVRAWWFSDGLYIVKAHPAFSRLLGARIEKIGALTAAQAHERVKPYLSGNDQRIRFLSPGYLVSPVVLKQIGATDKADSVHLTMQLADGKAEEIKLDALAQGDPGDERLTGLNRGYAVLIPDPASLRGRWSHVLDNLGDRSLLYSTRSDVQTSFLGAAKDVLYIRIDSVASVDDTPLQDKFATIIQKDILPARPRNIIVDLRLNNGGDFFNTILFSQAMPRLVPRGGRVLVLVGRATFSAGIVTAAMLKGAGGDKVSLIGETMGDDARFWAEGKKVLLPNSRISVRYASQFQDYEKGCTELSTCYWATVAFGPRGISLAPEIMIDTSFAAYANGRDIVLEAAMDQIGQRAQ